MSGELFAFFVLALIAIAGGVLMLNLTKVVHMVVALVFTFLAFAGLYVTLSAEFVAIVQVLIYSGAITIIILFGIMLTKHNDEEVRKPHFWKRLFVTIGIIAFFLVMYFSINDLSFGSQATTLHEDNAVQIGKEMYSKYIIPFELTSVLLLVALIGAIILSKKDTKEGEANE
ncbi:NADH-quinone oxidoreductase subunit J [Calidifontibacillus erzurumensis]|uniref:NADH-quinone oxidoreductase subunit J n=1 Tax=Calidifontibacillus erzurumensis TaxID=2741433 RepID=A0A8J8K8M3_9BACI|nr:NADH-quinone oxidoreductase subunit J [Calidifontibacillus erzurumensis]NSL52071.1 NADH-quinone oxidoreductase subunit J [Calidifontibacillus erzurumensis]